MKKTIKLAALSAILLGSISSYAFAAGAVSEACTTKLDIDVPSNCKDIAVKYPIAGLHNFRQLTTPDGNIKENMLFRSDQLNELTEADIKKLTELGVETIVDLRAYEELEEHPNKHLPSADHVVNIPIGTDPADVAKIMPVEVAAKIRPFWFEGKFKEIEQLLKDNNVDIPQVRKDRYAEFATKFEPQVSRYLHILANKDNYPVVFHCAGGKDRTGYLAAVTMIVLGYDYEDAMNDYLTTNLYTYPKLSKLVDKGPMSLRPIFGAHPEQLDAAFKAIKDKHGSFENYLENVLNISEEDVKNIRANLLKS